MGEKLVIGEPLPRRRLGRDIGKAPGRKTLAAMNHLILPGRAVFICDTHVNENPDAEQLAEIALMAAEAFSPSFGILGIGGLVAFMLGGAILIDTDVPQFQISWPAVASVAFASLALTVVIARLALVSRRRKIVSGREELIGASGRVLDWNNGTGHVFVHSERWQAAGTADLAAGMPVRVTGLEGLTLDVIQADTGFDSSMEN